MIVTVAIPVLNGARYLDEVLGAVRAQEVDREVEILVVDSGSSDESIEVARKHGARVHEIAKSEFSHGGTRNLIMELARGEHVAFLTQDATPAHERWLASLLEGFEQASDVGAVFGPHIARPDSSHVIKAEMERHFANWGHGQQISVQRLDSTPEGLAVYRADPGRLTFLSSVNCCVARSAWKQVPFRNVPYAEDQLLGRELIEVGFAKVFHPEAGVLHSHRLPPRQFFRRYFDEFRGLREVLDHREPANLRHVVRSVRALTRADQAWLEQQGVRGSRLRRALGYSRRHHTARLVGAALGSRADRLPASLRSRLSLEGRATFTHVDVPRSSLISTGENVTVRPDWAWEFVRRAYPTKPLVLEPHTGRARGSMTIAWIVPPWGVGSGGHSVIFELICQLEARGHSCAVFVFDPLHQNAKRGTELRDEVRQHFAPIKAEVFVGLEDFESADIAVATNWWSAYPVRDLPRCREKVYLVQDHESQFVPTSVETIWSEETYRMGYRCVAYTPWLANMLAERYGLEVVRIDCGVDTKTYTYAGPEGREAGLIAVYARYETHRRGVELAFAGLATLFERRLGQRVLLYGSNQPLTVPFPAESIGVVSPRELAALYRRASVGLVFSLTNLSLVTQEMMASGLPVVELDGDNVTTLLGRSGELAMLAAPRPDAVADALHALLDEPERAAEMAVRAHRFVEARTWRRAGEQLEQAFRRFLEHPRHAPVPAPYAVGAPADSGVLQPVRSTPPGALFVERALVTELLYDRLAEEDRAELERLVAADESTVDVAPVPGLRAESKAIRDVWRGAGSELDRKRLALALTTYYRMRGALERTGMSPTLPPDEIHLMGRGPLASGGSTYHADLVVDALASTGFEVRPGMRGLDFGCSSGRVVRVLAAAYPATEWFGCDPIESSIAWARENLPQVEFDVSPVEPPLAYDDAFFDFVFAISIWSHFAEGPARYWLDEMARIIRPGGRLMLTSHGLQTLAYYARNHSYPQPSLTFIRDALYSAGFCFQAVFGQEGDWGLVNPDWGMAFMAPEWLLTQACPSWRVAEFAAGRNEGNQDVFVLERSETLSAPSGAGGVRRSSAAAG